MVYASVCLPSALRDDAERTKPDRLCGGEENGERRDMECGGVKDAGAYRPADPGDLAPAPSHEDLARSDDRDLLSGRKGAAVSVL